LILNYTASAAMWEFIPGVKVDIAEVEKIFNRLKFALIREATLAIDF